MPRLIILFILVFCVAGCGTPSAVKKLSQEQVQTQQAFDDSLKSYLHSVADFADAQVRLADRLIDDYTRRIAGKYEEATGRKILAGPNDKQELKNSLDILTRQLIEDFKIAQEQKNQIGRYVEQLKQTQEKILASFNGIHEAQTKLNEYIQLEKTEAALLNELVGKMGLNEKTLSDSVNESIALSEKLQTIFMNLES